MPEKKETKEKCQRGGERGSRTRDKQINALEKIFTEALGSTASNHSVIAIGSKEDREPPTVPRFSSFVYFSFRFPLFFRFVLDLHLFFLSSLPMASTQTETKEDAKFWKLQRIVFTGADDNTDIDELIEFGDKYTNAGVPVEFGMLVAQKEVGIAKYPRCALPEHARASVLFLLV